MVTQIFRPQQPPPAPQETPQELFDYKYTGICGQEWRRQFAMLRLYPNYRPSRDFIHVPGWVFTSIEGTMRSLGAMALDRRLRTAVDAQVDEEEEGLRERWGLRIVKR